MSSSLRPLVSLTIPLLGGCLYDGVTFTEFDDHRDDVEARLVVLEADNAALASTVADLSVRLEALEAASVDHARRLDDLEAAGSADLSAYVRHDSLDPYADAAALVAAVSALELEQALVGGRVTSLEDTTASDTELAATSSLLQAQITAITDDYLTSASLLGYATEGWVNAQGYLTDTTAQAQIDSSLEFYTTDILDPALAPLSEGLSTAQADIVALDSSVNTILADYLTSADLSRVRADTTWVIDEAGSGDFTTIEDAIAALDGVMIDQGVTLTLQIEDGDYYPPAEIRPQTPYGAQVHIIGDELDPGNVALHFPAGSNGIWLENVSLGLLSGVTLNGSGAGVGLEVRDHAWVQTNALVIDGFDAGLDVVTAMVSVVDSDSRVTIRDALYGAKAGSGAVLWLLNATVEGRDGSGEGVVADQGSVVYASNASVTGFATSAAAKNTSYLDFSDASTVGGLVEASWGSHLDARSSTLSDSTGDGVQATASSVRADNIAVNRPAGRGLNTSSLAMVYAPSASVVDAGDVSYFNQFNSFIFMEAAVGDTDVASWGLEPTDFVYP